MDGPQREAWAKQLNAIVYSGRGDAFHQAMAFKENLGLSVPDFSLVVDSALTAYIPPENLQRFISKYHLDARAEGFGPDSPLPQYTIEQVTAWVADAVVSVGGIVIVQVLQTKNGVDDFTIAAALTANNVPFTADEWLSYCEANPLTP